MLTRSERESRELRVEVRLEQLKGDQIEFSSGLTV